MLLSLATLNEAEQALREGRIPYARALLENVTPFPGMDQERRLAILRAKCGLDPASEICEDEALLLKAEASLLDGKAEDAERYLLAHDHRDENWHRLMGEVFFRRGDYRTAAEHYHRAENAFDLRERLEICYRELEDYKMAYFYAKK